jgi:hypothetical protein
MQHLSSFSFNPSPGGYLNKHHRAARNHIYDSQVTNGRQGDSVQQLPPSFQRTPIGLLEVI